ncbi:MAG TPA: hypothetical protein VN445_01400 [Rectinemataceae bacterium]|nr:hypothetical protein [Rectinemataceae bacterium]
MKTLWRALAILTVVCVLGFGLYTVAQFSGTAVPAVSSEGRPFAQGGDGALAAGAQGFSGLNAQKQSGTATPDAISGSAAHGHAPLSVGAKLAAVGLAFAKFTGVFAAAALALALTKLLTGRGKKTRALALSGGRGTGPKPED